MGGQEGWGYKELLGEWRSYGVIADETLALSCVLCFSDPPWNLDLWEQHLHFHFLVLSHVTLRGLGCLPDTPCVSMRRSAAVCTNHGTVLQLTSSCLLCRALLAVRLPSETLETQLKGHLSCPLPPALS